MCFFLSFISEEETSAATAHQSDELLLPINVVKATHDVMSNSAGDTSNAVSLMELLQDQTIWSPSFYSKHDYSSVSKIQDSFPSAVPGVDVPANVYHGHAVHCSETLENPNNTS